MKDIPIFDTEYGVASLILKEIPSRREAYIRIRSLEPGKLEALVRECALFCRMAGAERVYAAHWEGMESYPLHTVILEMQGIAREDPEKSACLFPVTEGTVARWRNVYNERMKAVDNVATLEQRDEEQLLSAPGASFVHDGSRLLGIFWLEGDTLLAVVAAEPGAGERVMHTVFSLREGRTLRLEVASTNHRAIRLYEKLGFLKTGENRRWYCV